MLHLSPQQELLKFVFVPMLEALTNFEDLVRAFRGVSQQELRTGFGEVGVDFDPVIRALDEHSLNITELVPELGRNGNQGCVRGQGANAAEELCGKHRYIARHRSLGLLTVDAMELAVPRLIGEVRDSTGTCRQGNTITFAKRAGLARL